ncbi:hypothetical protein [Gordonibacter massiliensis (ex Traore et al. 2017)]|uniref:hypothetical protein n=1 Tax=Gordonibacter massiliensis (ex Traore et al. 2017) TaxID=1841863 RepID=UPI001C8B1540|nr:hypothetical protein [Gordonibacter massiliensis (ex Traore et al. 2017)]MBX9032642.1 hypothetical protein [Gordonibacter massiliensis (ex Traore et al. 2017)]
MNARLQAERVCCWIKENPRALNVLMRIAHDYVDAGRPRLTRSRAYSMAEDRGIAITDRDGSPDEDVARNHNFWPCLTRYMVMLRPRLARTLHFRESAFDEIDLQEVWRNNVNAGTVFFASDRKEAQRLVEIGDVTAL